jgi:hypothetical protein
MADLSNRYNRDCLHCSISEFIEQWRAERGETHPAELLLHVGEVLADLLRYERDGGMRASLRRRLFADITAHSETPRFLQ